MEPEPVKGLIIKNSVSSLGMPNRLKIGDAKLDIIDERPLACNSSTIEKIATRYGKVFMHKSIDCLAPSTKDS